MSRSQDRFARQAGRAYADRQAQRAFWFGAGFLAVRFWRTTLKILAVIAALVLLIWGGSWLLGALFTIGPGAMLLAYPLTLAALFFTPRRALATLARRSPFGLRALRWIATAVLVVTGIVMGFSLVVGIGGSGSIMLLLGACLLLTIAPLVVLSKRVKRARWDAAQPLPAMEALDNQHDSEGSASSAYQPPTVATEQDPEGGIA